LMTLERNLQERLPHVGSFASDVEPPKRSHKLWEELFLEIFGELYRKLN
jgi:hypothetical protein